MHSGQHGDGEEPATGAAEDADGAEGQLESTGRPRRSAYRNGHDQKARGRQHIESYNSVDNMEDESDATSSGGEWEGDDDGDVDDNIVGEEDDADVDMSDDEASIVEEDVDGNGDARRRSLVVSLRYQKNHVAPANNSTPGGGGPPDGIGASKPALAPAHEIPELRSYTPVRTGSPAPPITNIHAAVVTQPSIDPIVQADSIPNGHMAGHGDLAWPKR